jgi:hypothetical protein
MPVTHHKFVALCTLCLLGLTAACGPAGGDLLPLAELPDPHLYALTAADLPAVGTDWQTRYDDYSEQERGKWVYVAYEASQPPTLGGDLGFAFSVLNDVIVYEEDVSGEDLPQPPDELGAIAGLNWQLMTSLRSIGDQTAVWRTTIGELQTPAWWLEFYKGHAYVRISLFGLPDALAYGLIHDLADVVAGRLPDSVTELRQDAIESAQSLPSGPPANSTPAPQPAALLAAEPDPASLVTALSYTIPPGETGMYAYLDETAAQLADGVLGSDSLLADLGNGAAYEWVGWRKTANLKLLFALPQSTSLAAVQIGFNHAERFGVYLPAQVTINGLAFDLPADLIPDNQRAFLSFPGPFSGPQLEISLSYRGQGWIVVDEVRFVVAEP